MQHTPRDTLERLNWVVAFRKTWRQRPVNLGELFRFEQHWVTSYFCTIQKRNQSELNTLSAYYDRDAECCSFVVWWTSGKVPADQTVEVEFNRRKEAKQKYQLTAVTRLRATKQFQAFLYQKQKLRAQKLIMCVWLRNRSRAACCRYANLLDFFELIERFAAREFASGRLLRKTLFVFSRAKQREHR